MYSILLTDSLYFILMTHSLYSIPMTYLYNPDPLLYFSVSTIDQHGRHYESFTSHPFFSLDWSLLCATVFLLYLTYHRLEYYGWILTNFPFKLLRIGQTVFHSIQFDLCLFFHHLARKTKDVPVFFSHLFIPLHLSTSSETLNQPIRYYSGNYISHKK